MHYWKKVENSQQKRVSLKCISIRTPAPAVKQTIKNQRVRAINTQTVTNLPYVAEDREREMEFKRKAKALPKYKSNL